MRNGIVYPQAPLALLIGGTESGLWPTPTQRDWKDTGQNVNWEKVAKKSRLMGAVMWPTPASNSGTGGCVGLAGGSGNRKKLYAMLGEEEGKKLGCQSLNPYWVEWLMGYPIGWTDLKDSATPSSRKLPNGSADKS
jgi:DNA (cytosine-5)-methyltransferase 1